MKKILKKSPINYFSDLFVAAMVVVWILVIILMCIFAVYSTIVFEDSSIWCELGSLVAVPLSCGGAIWMIKNGVQHAIANSRGEKCPEDFPAVDEDINISGREEPFEMPTGTNEEACG